MDGEMRVFFADGVSIMKKDGEMSLVNSVGTMELVDSTELVHSIELEMFISEDDDLKKKSIKKKSEKCCVCVCVCV